ncbi:MAG: hypothetical protein K5656_02250 [Lachnospiraceae bacterium]|nr:hypothetical protein [Lachnospiraceae bacterium]
MVKRFINVKDRIVAMAIKQINESGLEALTLENVALVGGIPLEVVVRCFGDRDELLVAVAHEYVKFDDQVFDTVKSKEMDHIDKILEMFKLFSTYYTNYGDMATFVVDYEGLLHNVNTRNIISNCIEGRRNFVMKEYTDAVKDGEIKEIFTPNEFATILFGSASRDVLYRRIGAIEHSHSEVTISMISKLFDLLKK